MTYLPPNQYPQDEEPRLVTRRTAEDEDPHSPFTAARKLPPAERQPKPTPEWRTPRRFGQAFLLLILLLAIAALAGWFGARHWVRATTRAALPQLDGTLAVPGLQSPVTVTRDAHGVPYIQAATLDDLVFAQAFTTTGDRLFQMDLLRRHAAGELAEILGASLVPHDRMQRTLQIRAAADRAITQLPPDQLHLLEVYARGVNASIAQQSAHLPLEFHILGYKPAPWTPRDSLLVSLAMFQDLTNAYPVKLDREALAAQLPPALIQDMYPVGSWRDHPPTTPEPDLTIPGPPVENVPLDESQALNSLPKVLGAPGSTVSPSTLGSLPGLLGQQQNTCPDCTPGSNNWVVSGAHTATGKPMLSNDMHLNHTLPGIWYEVDLQAPNLHVAGVSIPGLPLIVVGHNDHVAWGFTNLGADVQDLYLETLRNSGSAQQFQAPDGTWQPVQHLPELIRVKHGMDIHLDVLATRHGDTLTPILTPELPGEQRTIALRWTLYDPTVLRLPVLAIAQAQTGAALTQAFSTFGGPAQNLVYADDAGHIGYHAVGSIPLRGPAPTPASTLPEDLQSPVDPRDPNQSPTIAASPSPLTATDIQAPAAPIQPQKSGPLSPVPLVPSLAHEWSGYIPYDQLPQITDPPGGVIATANARIVPDDYPYPIALNWAAPYRNERIWHVLAGTTNLRPEDMLHLQTDIYSDFDHVLAQRIAYAVDHSPALNTTPATTFKPHRTQQLRAAADLLRNWNGRMSTDSPAPAIVAAVHATLWPMLLEPQAQASRAQPQLRVPQVSLLRPGLQNLADIYRWGERDYALEQILMHTPARWLPPAYRNWDDFLTAALDRALLDARAPADLATWRYGAVHTLDIEAPVFEQSDLLRRLLGRPTGTGPIPQSGDGTTIKQVGKTFGPSERFTTTPGDWTQTTLNLVAGQSGNPSSPFYLDQFPAWLHGTTNPFPFAPPTTTHTLQLTP